MTGGIRREVMVMRERRKILRPGEKAAQDPSGPYRPGMKVEAPCENCKGFVPATFELGRLVMDDGTVIDGVMRAVCDRCGSVLAVAQQSAPVIREALDRRDAGRRTTIRLPRALAEQVEMRLTRKGAPPTHYQALLAAFANALRHMGAADREMLVARLRSGEVPYRNLKKDVTINLDLGHNLAGFMDELRREVGIQQSELVRRIFAAVKDQPEVDRHLQELSIMF